MTTPDRQRLATTALNIVAIGFGLGAIPLISEVLFGVGGAWSIVCFGLAFIPPAIAFGLWRRQRWSRMLVLIVGWSSILYAVFCFLVSPLAPGDVGHDAIRHLVDLDGVGLTVWLVCVTLPSVVVVFVLHLPMIKALFGAAADGDSSGDRIPEVRSGR